MKQKDLPAVAHRINDLEELARTLSVPQKEINKEYTYSYREAEKKYKDESIQFYHEKAVARVKAVYHPMVGRHDVD